MQAPRSYLDTRSGNSGQAIVGKWHAWLITDSRFWEQAERQLDLSRWTVVTAGGPGSPRNYIEWLAVCATCIHSLLLAELFIQKSAHLSRVAVDPHVIPVVSVQAIKITLTDVGSTLLFPESNFVDIAW